MKIHFSFPDAQKIADIETLMTTVRRNKNSVGAKVTVIAQGVPIGLGEPVFDKLDAEIAKAMMGIHAAKGVEIGDGFSATVQSGSEQRDEISKLGFSTNHAGGILGGIATGQDIIVNVAFKPTSSIPTSAKTISTSGEETSVCVKGRHDPCVGIRAVPVVEARLAMVLMDHYLLHRARFGAVKPHV